MNKGGCHPLFDTEGYHQLSHGLDLLDTHEILARINDEDQTVAVRVRDALDDIARAVELIADRFKAGGRLIYVGAGTSARLAVADAAELPPTYGIDPERLPVVIAGGKDAVFRACETEEDSGDAAVEELKRLGLAATDIVLGLTASGTTKFVAAALGFARTAGAGTVLIACNSSALPADVKIIVRTGPELVAGSTRMRAATAQRMVLTMLSTTVAIRLGLVYDGLMVAMKSRNAKCSLRAIRAVQQITGAGATESEEALQQAEGDIRLAVLFLRTHDLDTARELLEAAGGSLRKALVKAQHPSAGEEGAQDDQQGEQHVV